MMFQEIGSGADVPKFVLPSEVVTPEPMPEFVTVRHVIFGPLRGVQETIQTLHARCYADVNDWSPLQPSGKTGEFVTVLIRRLRLG